MLTSFNLSLSSLYTESKQGGFTFHETTPIISSFQLNPVKDSEFTIELAVVLAASTCPRFSVRTHGHYLVMKFNNPYDYFYHSQEGSKYRISIGTPRGCEKISIHKCDYFLGINTNGEDSDYLDFTLEGRAKGWIAVGFSETPTMVKTYHP